MANYPIEPQAYTIVDLNRGSEDRGNYKAWFEINALLQF